MPSTPRLKSSLTSPRESLFSFFFQGTIVVQAAGLTMAVFLGLTIFTFQTKIDFSFLVRNGARSRGRGTRSVAIGSDARPPPPPPGCRGIGVDGTLLVVRVTGPYLPRKLRVRLAFSLSVYLAFSPSLSSPPGCIAPVPSPALSLFCGRLSIPP